MSVQPEELTSLQVGTFAYPLSHGTLQRHTTATGQRGWEITSTPKSICHLGQDILHQLVFEAGGKRYMGTAWLDNVRMSGVSMEHHFLGTGELATLG
jgi:hypothetical protein